MEVAVVDEIILGNCLIEMGNMEDCCIDLTVTSPPYDNLRDYLRHSEFDFQGIARELYRITKIGGVVVWVVADATINGSETGTSFRQALYFMEVGFNLHDTMIYHRERLPLTHNRYEQHFEYMFILSKGTPNTFNPITMKATYAGQSLKGSTVRHTGKETQPIHKPNTAVKQMKIMGNVWKYTVGFNHNTKDNYAYKHPATFPDKLASDHILSWSNPGDLILDPFAGSGTTCKMAKLHNRHFIGIEINPEYIEICNQRLSQEVFDFG